MTDRIEEYLRLREQGSFSRFYVFVAMSPTEQIAVIKYLTEQEKGELRQTAERPES